MEGGGASAAAARGGQGGDLADVVRGLVEDRLSGRDLGCARDLRRRRDAHGGSTRPACRSVLGCRRRGRTAPALLVEGISTRECHVMHVAVGVSAAGGV